MSTPRSDQDSPWKDVLRLYFPEAIAFCQQLSKKTGNLYRLPSEAEWEYACRAGTTTPFHFGETIATDLANYNGNYTYGRGIKGTYREGTISVGILNAAQSWTFQKQMKMLSSNVPSVVKSKPPNRAEYSFPANAFGLYDMHGNIWEWCEDCGHNNYKGAPTNGSAWLSKNWLSKKDGGNRVIRGGSWTITPGGCRSTIRFSFEAWRRYDITGFRVVCSASRTLKLN